MGNFLYARGREVSIGVKLIDSELNDKMIELHKKYEGRNIKTRVFLSYSVLEDLAPLITKGTQYNALAVVVSVDGITKLVEFNEQVSIKLCALGVYVPSVLCSISVEAQLDSEDHCLIKNLGGEDFYLDMNLYLSKCIDKIIRDRINSLSTKSLLVDYIIKKNKYKFNSILSTYYYCGALPTGKDDIVPLIGYNPIGNGHFYSKNEKPVFVNVGAIVRDEETGEGVLDIPYVAQIPISPKYLTPSTSTK